MKTLHAVAKINAIIRKTLDLNQKIPTDVLIQAY